MQKYIPLHFLSFIVSSAIFVLASCKTAQSVPYFADFPDSARATGVTKAIPFKNPLIQPDDVLSITLQTIDQTVDTPVNTTNATNEGAGSQPINGYLVDKDGMVEMPFIGKIKLSGLSTSEARDTITNAANKLFNNPIVNVRLVNFKITVLGEVGHPSTFIMPNEKVTIFDAIGIACDLTLYGKRDDILLVRDSTGDNRKMVRLNLNSKNIVSSPYFYLQPNDLVYVAPNKNRLISNDAVTTRRITLLTTALSTISILIVILSRF